MDMAGVYSKTPVREDYCTYLTPATHLLALRREKAEVEQALVKQKEVSKPTFNLVMHFEHPHKGPL